MVLQCGVKQRPRFFLLWKVLVGFADQQQEVVLLPPSQISL